MRERLRTLVCAAAVCIAAPADAATLNLKLASWNLEHLAEADDKGCRPRKPADYALLKSYAMKLNADIIAVQEVENAAALARVFDPAIWALEISVRPDQAPAPACAGMPGHNLITQRTGFAIRKTLRYTRNPDEKRLDVDSDNLLRYGVDITVDAGRPLRMLSVHLKSGCSRDPADSPRHECKQLFRQQPVLKEWVKERAGDKVPFIILGDFNRQLQDEEEFWTRLDTPDGEERDLALPVAKGAVSRCRTGLPKFIDYIVFGMESAKFADRSSFEVLRYDEEEKNFPSDHCPISIRLEVRDLKDAKPQPDQITIGLKWFRRSAEYKLLTRYLYEQAARRVDEISQDMGSSANWLVSLDADETILDNSFGQLESEALGLGYDSTRWKNWVGRAAAEGVPGAIAFMNHVLASGGKIAVITNRDLAQDGDTRANLVRLGLHDEPAKVCVFGRASADKQESNPIEWQQYGYQNDKDRRRRLFREGAAARCWAEDADGSVRLSWNKPHRIALSIGDNVQDMPGQVQDTARKFGTPDLVFGRDYFVIPNPLYGSWDRNAP